MSANKEGERMGTCSISSGIDGLGNIKEHAVRFYGLEQKGTFGDFIITDEQMLLLIEGLKEAGFLQKFGVYPGDIFPRPTPNLVYVEQSQIDFLKMVIRKLCS